MEIEEEGSAYWVSVVSKVNPVTVKGRRYGPAARLALQSGESFEIAKYEVQVLLPQPAPVAVSRRRRRRCRHRSTTPHGCFMTAYHAHLRRLKGGR